MAFKSQVLPFLCLNLFVLLLFHTTLTPAKMLVHWPVDKYFGDLHKIIPWPDPGHSKLSRSLHKAGYQGMSWFVENKLIPTVRSVYGYNDTITIFAPTNWAFYFYHGETNVLQQVVPLNLDRDTFRSNFSKDSTFPTFSQDFANPSFELSDHIRVTDQPLIEDAAGREEAGGEAKASINNVPINDWDIYNDGRVIVHGVPHLFDDPHKVKSNYYQFPLDWKTMKVVLPC